MNLYRFEILMLICTGTALIFTCFKYVLFTEDESFWDVVPWYLVLIFFSFLISVIFPFDRLSKDSKD